MNFAETMLTHEDKSAYVYLCSCFAENLCWGTSFIANEESFRALENAANNYSTPSKIYRSLQLTVEKHQEEATEGIRAIRSTVAEIQMQLQQSDYLDVVNIAKEPPTPAPFSSLSAAEKYLAASPENMDVLKTMFGNSQAVLMALQRNKQAKEANKNRAPPLQSRVLWEFLFTKSVLNSLCSRVVYE